jgi:hypothetical protein
VTEPIVVPAARVVLKPLLFAFATLAGYFVAWGLVFVMDAVVRAFFGTATGAISWIPYAGKVLSTPLLAIEHKLTSYLGGLEAHFDNQMAARWHALASLVTQLAYDTKAAAILDWNIARKVATSFGNTVVLHVTGDIRKIIHAVEAQIHGLVPHVTRVTKIVGAKADGAIVRRVGALAGELDHVIDWTIPRLRARERAAEGEIGRLWKRVRRERVALGIGAATALFVAVLGRLGLGFLRCKGIRSAGRRVCGMNPSLLDALLADTLLIAGTLSLEEFAREMVGVTSTAVRPITTFWRAS